MKSGGVVAKYTGKLEGQVYVLKSGDSWASRQGKPRRVVILGVLEAPDGMELEHGFQYHASVKYGDNAEIVVHKTVRRMLTPAERKSPLRDLLRAVLGKMR